MTDTAQPDFDGCRRACRLAGAHTLVYGECEQAPEPEPTVSLSRVYTDTDGRPSIGFDTYTVPQLARLIEGAVGDPLRAAAAARAIVHRNAVPAAGRVVSDTPTQTDDRAAVSAALWAAAQHHTVAEWICCEPINPGHDLCTQGGAALQMLKALLADDPEAWKPAPLLDVVMGLVPPTGSTAEAHRLSLSEALDLGTGAPWDAIHERVQELRRMACNHSFPDPYPDSLDHIRNCRHCDVSYQAAKAQRLAASMAAEGQPEIEQGADRD